MTESGYSGRKLNRFEKLRVWINKTWGWTEEEIKYAIWVSDLGSWMDGGAIHGGEKLKRKTFRRKG